MTQLSDFSASLPLHAAPDLRRGSAAEQLLAADETLLEKMVRLERENAALRERAEDAEKGWHDTLAARGYQGPVERNTHDILASLAQLAEEQLAVSRHILAALGNTSEDRTSVKIETGAKREIKSTVHVYAGDTDQAANAWLVEEAIRLHGLAQAYCDEGSTP